jgi:hypothetical protein
MMWGKESLIITVDQIGQGVPMRRLNDLYVFNSDVTLQENGTEMNTMTLINSAIRVPGERSQIVFTG